MRFLRDELDELELLLLRLLRFLRDGLVLDEDVDEDDVDGFIAPLGIAVLLGSPSTRLESGCSSSNCLSQMAAALQTP